MSSGAREEYERAFGEMAGARHVRAVGMGRQGLMILLKAMGVGAGDWVGVCGYSCVAVTEAVKMAGGVAIYLDVDEYGCIDPAEVRGAGRGSMKAVIVQHTFGVPGRLEELMEACAGIGARVIEDCAHAMGGTWKGKQLGTFGDGAMFSQGWGKSMPLGRGAMVTTDSEAVIERVDEELERWALPESGWAEMRSGAERRIYKGFVGMGAEETLLAIDAQMYRRGLRREPSERENGFRMYRGYVRISGEVQSRAGLKGLREWPSIRARRMEMRGMIEKRLRGAGRELWPTPKEAEAVMVGYPMLTTRKAEALETARRKRVNLAGYFGTPVHPLWGEELAEVGYRMGECPRGEMLAERLVHVSTTSDTALRGAEVVLRCDMATNG